MIDIYGGYAYKKNIDWSVLQQGIGISVTIQKMCEASLWLYKLEDRGRSSILGSLRFRVSFQAGVLSFFLRHLFRLISYSYSLQLYCIRPSQ